LFAAVAALLAPAIPARAQEQPQPLPVEVRTDGFILARMLVAQQRSGRLYLPLAALSEALEFPTEIEPSQAYAEGWFLAEDRRVTFDVRRGEVVSEGRRIEAAPEDFLTHELDTFGELYVARDLLNEAWPVTLVLDMSNLILNVDAAEPLPVQRRRQRAERRKRLFARQGRDLDLTPVQHPYRLWTNPAFDVSSRIDAGQGTVRTRQTIDWSQDLFKASSRGLITLSGEDADPEIDNLQYTFRRSDIVEDLPLGLKDIQAGDVSRQARDRIGGLTRGRGIVVSSFPLARAEQFDTTTIEGDAPPGYEAELYRNGRLLEFQVVDDDGRYAFEDVALIAGFNRFRVVLYGPQGQIRERVETIDASQALARPGETLGRVALIDAGRDLIPIGTPSANTEERGASFNALVAHGLTQQTSAFAALTALPTEEGNQQYVVGGLNSAVLAGSAQLRAFGAADGGLGLDARMLQRLEATRVVLRTGYFEDFESPDVGFGPTATLFDAELRTNTRLDLGFARLNLEADGAYEAERDGSRRLTFDTGQRLRWRRLGFSHRIAFDLRNDTATTFDGTVNANLRARPFSVRGGLRYDDRGLTSTRLDLRYRGRAGFSLGADGQLGFNGNASSATLDVTRQLGPILTSVTAGWDEGQGMRFGLLLNFAFGPGADGSYALDDEDRARSGSVRARVFLDENADGDFDAGEPPIPGAQFGGDARDGQARTDENGRLLVHGLQPLRPQSVTLRSQSLENPFWLPAEDGYSVVPRPGAPVELDMPVTMTGAVDGTVRMAETGEGVPGITVRLIDSDGEVVKETVSFFGGFFAFDQVRYGSYRLAIAQTKRFKVVDAPPEVMVNNDMPFASQQDIGLARR